MTPSFTAKAKTLKDHFANAKTAEDRYNILITLGKELPKTPKEHFTPNDLVEGCQSLMYLKGHLHNNVLTFEIFSEALISSGLAALLLLFYTSENPEDILSTPPSFIQELNLTAGLSPGRSNGLAALYKKIRLLALQGVIEISNR